MVAGDGFSTSCDIGDGRKSPAWRYGPLLEALIYAT
jgi:hypothetical protein